MLHRICILAAGAMVALSIFLVFRPRQQLDGIQPPLGALVATECVAHPEIGAIPPEYGCVKFEPARVMEQETEQETEKDNEQGTESEPGRPSRP